MPRHRVFGETIMDIRHMLIKSDHKGALSPAHILQPARALEQVNHPLGRAGDKRHDDKLYLGTRGPKGMSSSM